MSDNNNGGPRAANVISTKECHLLIETLSTHAFMRTSRHLATLGVVLPLFTVAAARVCWRAGV